MRSRATPWSCTRRWPFCSATRRRWPRSVPRSPRSSFSTAPTATLAALRQTDSSPRTEICGDSEPQTLGGVARDGGRLEACTAQSDMAVGTHDVERRSRDLRACQFGVVAGVGGNGVDAQHIALVQQSFARGGLPDHDQVELRVVELLEHILDGAVGVELELEPRKAIAGARRAAGQPRQ